ncbi:MFS transporter, DHA1 family, purine ribonucleoside efflux pump/MFS transporter, DHA1 family, bicyclomycin/chloramphenicol resistance protein [Fulvimarina manganoxydans]|uniref:Bcr/CflA family efflux transporter n=2 Tax=Fulvimarina manganoxydans TaxID=937218 RepID=A0A1W2D8U3_9HYPH|nr:MFS transporter, DHA1 family, purine ribonucleoside efflux pump/MFS transporter, DHA1 family, bicyclomycin/chloramphenicol resistance protein [Fulvimarina manganoxydans]
MKPNPTPVMSERRTSLIGGLLVAIGPISLALYTPAMPVLVDVFGVTESLVKLTLTAYFAGFAVTQLVCGPLSDALGRRITTLIFMATYLGGSLIAVLAPSIDMLLLARLVQGVGASVGIAVARAIVRDQFEGETSSRIMNAIGIILAAGPAVSPTIGGLSLEVAGWRGPFALMALFGIAVIAVSLLAMRETIVPDKARLKPRLFAASYRRLLSDGHFVTASLTMGGSVGALYTLSTVLPFVLINRAGLTPTEFGIGMLGQTGLFFFGSLSVRFLMGRGISAYRLVLPGLVFIAIASGLLILSAATLPLSYLSIMGPVGIYAFGIAFIMPAMTTSAMAPFKDVAGAAAAMLGFLQMGAGFAGSALCAAIGEPVLATAIVIPLLCALALLAYALFRWRFERIEVEPLAQVPAPPMARSGQG